MALLISESGEKTRIVPDEGTKSFTLKQMQDYVGGGLIERVPVYDAEITVWCNEEGLLKDMKTNKVACMYLARISSIPSVVVGPIVIFEEGDTDPEWSYLGLIKQMEGDGGEDV